MTVSIVVVNWNAGAALDGCLESLAADGLAGRDVVLVDNDATDGSTADARASQPWVRVVETGRNLGFAGGANRGAAVARGEVLCFLNPDARVLPGAVQTLVDTLLRVPGAGIAGGGLVDDAGAWQPAAGRFGPVRHLMLDTTPGRLGARPIAWTGCTGRSWRSAAISSASSAVSTRATSSTARIWISATGPRGSVRARFTCRRRERSMART